VVRALWTLHSAAFGLNLAAIAVALVALSRAARAAALIPRWMFVLVLPGAGCLFVAAICTVAIAEGSHWLYLGYLGFALWAIFLVTAATALLQASMRTLHIDPSAHHAAVAYGALCVLSDAMNVHLGHEERGLEAFVAQHQDTPQFKGAEAAVRKTIKGDAGTFVAWLLDSAAPDTMRALRNHFPAPVLFLLANLGGRNYQRTIASVWN
jgi:hypothetical protein